MAEEDKIVDDSGDIDPLADYAEGNIPEFPDPDPDPDPDAGKGDEPPSDPPSTDEREDNVDWQSRFKDLEQQIAALKSAQSQPEPPPTPLPDQLSPDEVVWKSFSDDYPDIADPVQKLLKRQQEQFTQALDDLRSRTFEESMDAARPDWRDLANDQGFKAWLGSHADQQEKVKQPGVRAAMSVIRAYDDHKKAAEAIKAQRQARLKASEASPAKGNRAPNLSDSLEGWAAT